MHNGYKVNENYINGKDGEKIVSGGLTDEFPDDEVLQQVSGKFDDGTRTVFDDVVVDETGNVILKKIYKHFFSRVIINFGIIDKK